MRANLFSLRLRHFLRLRIRLPLLLLILFAGWRGMTLAGGLVEPGDESMTISSIVGAGQQGYGGDGGPAIEAKLNQPFDLVYDRAGNLYVSDTFNHCIRRIDGQSGFISTFAGTGRAGYAGDGGPATQALLNEPYGLAVADDGTLYIADRINRVVRKVEGRSGVMSTVAGNGENITSGDGGPASKAGLVEPNGLALDRAGKRLYIADVAAHRVRVVDLNTGVISTFAGDGLGRHAGDGGPALKASIFGARAVKVAPDGAVLILERQGNSLRRVDPATSVVTTIAGTGKKGFSGDGGPAVQATFNGPKELAVSPTGDIVIVDTENHAIRLIDAKTGSIRTVAGDGKVGGTGDGGPATSARLDRPHGVAFTPDSGAVVIGDTNNHRVRKARLTR